LERWLWLIPAAPLATFAVNALLALRGARRGAGPVPRGIVGTLACLGPAIAFVVSSIAFGEIRAGAEGAALHQTLYTWIASGSLSIPVGLRVDALSALMLLFVTGVGTLIHIYSTSYMHDEPGYERYFAYLNLFMFAMLVLVLADALPLLFVGWEGVGLCSYLLIGFWFEDPVKAAAGKKAFIVNRIGDFGVLLAMFLIFWTLQEHGAPGLEFETVRTHLTAFTPAVATAVCLLLFLGAAGKSAQIPLYVWLPDAMAGPTPVSALIHAATMVTAGVYLVARLGFLFDLAPVAQTVVALVGAATALVAATIAVAQNDFKKVLAYSTVSQLGYMFVGVGVGAYAAGIFHVFTHAFFKACLFLGSGAVIHALHGQQDIRHMGGLRRAMPRTFWTFAVATLALAGVPPLAGFFSKDAILWEALVRPNAVLPWLPKLLWGMLLVAAFLTAFYMWRLVSLVFLGTSRVAHDATHHLHDAPPRMAMPLVVLALCSVLVGFAGVPRFLGGSNWIEHWLHPAVTAPPGDSPGIDADGAVHHDTTPEMTHALQQHASEAAAQAPHSAAAEWGATLLAVCVGLAGLGLGHLFYAARPQLATAWAARAGGLRRVLESKYYVDEVYDAVIVQPVRRLSESVLWRTLDVRLIDGVVNLLGGITKASSYLFRFGQSGYVQTYVLVVVLGVVVLLMRVL